MNGLMIDNQETNYLYDLSLIFNELPDTEINKMWLISNYECNKYPFKEIPLENEYVWIDGNKLKELLNQEKVMFIWGVFSNFPKDTTEKEVLQFPIPIADGNRSLWDSELKNIHPLTDTEIIAWDGSLLLVKSNNTDVITQLQKKIPSSIDLELYNSK